MTKQQVVGITAVIAVLLCALHFVNSVYVAGESQQRELTQLNLTVSDNALPYNADTLQQLLAQWSLPQQAEPGAAETAESPLAGYDNTQLGDTRIALLAIYQQQQPKAVLALQQNGQPLNFVRLTAGENIGDIQLSQVTRRDVTITRGAQQVKLRLFNPVSASSE